LTDAPELEEASDEEATTPSDTLDLSAAPQPELSQHTELAPDLSAANDASSDLVPAPTADANELPIDTEAAPTQAEIDAQVKQLQQQAFMQLREKRHLEAIETLEQALALKEDFFVLMSLGLARLEAGQACQAIDVYERALLLQPDNPLPKDKLLEAKQGCKRRD
ncbi:MAG: hypothetical protein RBU37_26050, partial [Myxococcota bacterium]|nr:hypothetical protein [Myxococcota bacterium]